MAMFDCFCGPGLYKLGLFLYICFMKKQLNVILLALAAFAMPTVVCASHNYETCANAPPKQENEVFKIDNTICFEVKNDYCYEVTPFVLNAQPVITETILQPRPTLAESKPHYYNSFIKLVTWPDSKRYSCNGYIITPYLSLTLQSIKNFHIKEVTWPDSKRMTWSN